MTLDIIRIRLADEPGEGGDAEIVGDVERQRLADPGEREADQAAQDEQADERAGGDRDEVAARWQALDCGRKRSLNEAIGAEVKLLSIRVPPTRRLVASLLCPAKKRCKN